MLGNHPTWRVGTALSLHCSDRPNTLIWYIPSCEQQLLTCKPKQTCPALWHWTRLPAGRRWSYCVFLFNFFSCVMAMAFVNYLTNSQRCQPFFILWNVNTEQCRPSMLHLSAYFQSSRYLKNESHRITFQQNLWTSWAKSSCYANRITFAGLKTKVLDQ
jgi:hypothetical protein